jgi:hypothetical protein
MARKQAQKNVDAASGQTHDSSCVTNLSRLTWMMNFIMERACASAIFALPSAKKIKMSLGEKKKKLRYLDMHFLKPKK